MNEINNILKIIENIASEDTKKIVQSLLCGHGSRSKNYYQNLTEIKRKVQQRVNLKVFNCFLEINKPTLEEFLSKKF